MAIQTIQIQVQKQYQDWTQRKRTDLPSAGTMDSIIRRPRVLANKSAFTKFTLLVVITSKMPLITMARSSRVSRSSPLLPAHMSNQQLLPFSTVTDMHSRASEQKPIPSIHKACQMHTHVKQQVRPRVLPGQNRLYCHFKEPKSHHCS